MIAVGSGSGTDAGMRHQANIGGVDWIEDDHGLTYI